MDTTDVIYLYFYNAIDTVQANISVDKLEQYGFDGWSSRWIRNWNKDGWNKLQWLSGPNGDE